VAKFQIPRLQQHTQPLSDWFLVVIQNSLTVTTPDGDVTGYTFQEYWLEADDGSYDVKGAGRLGTAQNPGIPITGQTLEEGDFALAKAAEGAGNLYWQLVGISASLSGAYFPAQLTTPYSASTGYDWQLLVRETSPQSYILSYPAVTGNNAVEVGNNVTLQPGRNAIFFPDPTTPGAWMFELWPLPLVAEVCPIVTSGVFTGFDVETWKQDGSTECEVNPDDCCVTPAPSCSICPGSVLPSPMYVTFISGCSGLDGQTFEIGELTPIPGTGGAAQFDFSFECVDGLINFGGEIAFEGGSVPCSAGTVSWLDTSCLYGVFCGIVSLSNWSEEGIDCNGSFEGCAANPLVLMISSDPDGDCSQGFTWNCISNQCIPISGSDGQYATYSECLDGCGAGNPTFTPLGKAQVVGNTLSIPAGTIPAGSVLVLSILALSSSAPVPSATFGGNSFLGFGGVVVPGAITGGITYQAWLQVPTTTTGTVVINITNAIVILASMLEIKDLPNNGTEDINNGANGTASAPSIPPFGPTSKPVEFWVATTGSISASTITPSTWNSPFSDDGQDQTLTNAGIVYELQTGYDIVTSIGSPNPTMSGTQAAWSSLARTYS
jgi:hypothetical protein